MKMTKEQLMQAALALNGEDKKYEISVEGDKIITRVKWMDATFFSPASVTNEMRNFEFAVRVFDNGKYTELDKSVSVTTSAGRGGLNMNKSVFVGKQITFSKTVGVGKDHQTGETGIISNTFYSEEYKKPVRALLKESGYKKKMGTLGKMFLFGGIFAVIVVIAVALFLSGLNGKQKISIAQFETIAESNGYLLAIDHTMEENGREIETHRIALDSAEEYQIEFYDFYTKDQAKQAYRAQKNSVEADFSEKNIRLSSHTDLSKYQMYSITTDSEYLYIARVEDTVVYICTDAAYKEDTESFVKAMGY